MIYDKYVDLLYLGEKTNSAFLKLFSTVVIFKWAGQAQFFVNIKPSVINKKCTEISNGS